jgi:nucleoside-diphosphate-sugar epimerase
MGNVSILITGGTGFLGAHLARHLVEEKGRADVVLFDRSVSTERIADIADAVTIVTGDVLEPQEILAAMQTYEVDRVVHLASIAGMNDPQRIVPFARLACIGTANVFEAARIHGITRIGNASSIAAWGTPPGFDANDDAIPLVEDIQMPCPTSLYGCCKLWSEHLAHVYNETHGMEILSLRIPPTIGRGRLNRASLGYGLMMPETVHFMANPELAVLGHPVTMPPDHQLTDVLYASDGAEAWWCVLTSPKPEHAVFNLSAGHQRVGDMTKQMKKLLSKAKISVSNRPLMAGPIMDNTRLIDELGFTPRYTLESAVDAYVEDVRRATRLSD